MLRIIAGDRDLIVGRALLDWRELDDHRLGRGWRDGKGACIAENRERRVMFRRANVSLQRGTARIADRKARAGGRVRSRIEVQGTRGHLDTAYRGRSRRRSFGL